MDLVCPSCGAPVKPDDNFCNKCGAQLDASLALADGSTPMAPRPNALRDIIVFFVIAAIATLFADFVEVQLALRATWDIEFEPALYLVYLLLASGMFIILYVAWRRVFEGSRPAYSGRGLATKLVCLLLGISILFYGPIMDAVFAWSAPSGPTIWYQFDLLAALLGTLLFAGVLAILQLRSS